MPHKRLVLWLVAPILCIVVASWSFSLALEGGWLRRSLSARLAATFGRPVEVAHFGFSILGGPEFEADSVTVGEDARFGQEYFLRADRLSARLRWRAVLRGRMEFDRLSLSHPSLNLVRSADGTWNIETWLPAPNAQTPLQAYRSPEEIPAHASRIDIEAGRINFKKGVEKLPLALVDVNGSVNLQTAGRWFLDLEAHPVRAAPAARNHRRDLCSLPAGRPQAELGKCVAGRRGAPCARNRLRAARPVRCRFRRSPRSRRQ
jgi:uncharacterized protein involved in outer membrane biogenesis